MAVIAILPGDQDEKTRVRKAWGSFKLIVSLLRASPDFWPLFPILSTPFQSLKELLGPLQILIL